MTAVGMNTDKLIAKLTDWATKRESKGIDAALLREAAEQITELKRLNHWLREA